MIPYVIEKNVGDHEVAYDLYSRLLKDRIVFVRGLFDQDMADSVVAQLLFLESQSADDDVYMYVNSPGGHIDAMYAIYDVMNYVKTNIVTVGFGTCASAASFILAHGTKGKRFALPNTEIMIHELSTGHSGKANEIRNSYRHMERLYEKMAGQYSQVTGKDLDTVKRDMERDFFMTADEAVEYGLIDKVYVTR